MASEGKRGPKKETMTKVRLQKGIVKELARLADKLIGLGIFLAGGIMLLGNVRHNPAVLVTGFVIGLAVLARIVVQLVADDLEEDTNG